VFFMRNDVHPPDQVQVRGHASLENASARILNRKR
jgi:hypothetical protein